MNTVVPVDRRNWLLGDRRVLPAERPSRIEKVRLVVEVLVAYVRVRVLRRRHDLPTIVAATRTTRQLVSSGHEPGSFEDRLVGRRLGNAVQRTLRVLPTDSRCLQQSLVLSCLLSARGMPATLVIGARTEDEFGAHAWIEYYGAPLLPPNDFGDFRLLEI